MATGTSIEGNEIVKNLLILVLIPLVTGLVIRARFVADPVAWQRQLVRVANIALGAAHRFSLRRIVCAL
jgi:ACR3 family arsenite efflux pump ArsB